ncbi:hypothetical protein ACFPK9_13695 [Rubritalea spongiae]|uniref:DUF3108 domain-containing protein n=1 Tax=Rubritalea spongiae TaxID=430797 RepID=A0ABW5E089_9BACT
MLLSFFIFISLALSLLANPQDEALSHSPETTKFQISYPPYLSTWKSSEGSTLKATLVAVSPTEVILKTGTSLNKIPLSKLSFTSQIRAQLWHSANGSPFTLPACSLVYQLQKNDDPSTNNLIKVHYDGSHLSSLILTHVERRILYNHQDSTFSIFSLEDQNIATGSSLPIEPTLIQNVPSLEEWHPRNVNKFPGRFLCTEIFPTSYPVLANTSAPAVTALFSILNGQHIQYSSGKFSFESPDFKITAFSTYETKDAELEKSLQLAHLWNMLPLKLHWVSKVTNDKGKLELISIHPLEEGVF